MKDQTPTLASCLRSMFIQDHFQCLRDGALLRHFVEQDDGDAFVALMRRHGPMILSLARRVVRDHQMAEDVFQAAFLVLLRKARAIRGQESLPAWLHRVTFRLALRAKKSRKRFGNVDSCGCPASQGDPSDELARRESLTILDEELHNLPEKYQVPLILCHLEGLSQEAAAKRLNVSPGTVKGRLERGRALLRTMLAKRGLGADSVALGVVPSLPLVSPVLIQSTLRAAMTGHGASLGATALASGAIKMMFLAKLKSAALAVLLFGAVCWGAGWVALGAGGVQKEEVAAPSSVQLAKAAPPLQAKDKAVDLYGDPLPEGAVMRFGTVQLRAADTNLTISPDGKTLIGVRQSRYVSLWDVESGKLKETRELPVWPSFLFALSPEGRWLATSSQVGTLEVLDVQSGTILHKLTAKKVQSAGKPVFSPDGRHVAVVWNAQDGDVASVWDVQTGKKLFDNSIGGLAPVNVLSFAPDSKKLFAFFHGENGGYCWEVPSGKQVWHTEGLNSPYWVAFAPDGRVFSAHSALEIASGKPAKMERLHPEGTWAAGFVLPDQLTGIVWGLEGGSDVSVSLLWDLTTGKKLRTLNGAGIDMVTTPDGKTLITNNGALQRWELGTGKKLYPDNFDQGHIDEVAKIIFSADGKRMVTGAADGTVRHWDVTTGKAIDVWLKHRPRQRVPHSDLQTAGIRTLDITPDGRSIASAGTDNKLRTWDALSGKESPIIPLPSAEMLTLHISPDGRTITALSASNSPPLGPQPDPAMPVQADKGWLVSWDSQQGKLIHKVPVTYDTHLPCSFSRDGKIVVLGDRVVGVADGRDKLRLERAVVAPSQVPFAISPDGSLVAGDYREEKNNLIIPSGFQIWEAATGKLLSLIKTKQLAGELQFHPNHRLVAVHDSEGIHLWDLVSGTMVGSRKPPTATRSSLFRWARGTCFASCMAFTPDGRHLATGHPDGTILLWPVDLPLPKPVRLAANEIDSLWSTLKDADAAKAWQAVWRLTDAPEDAVPFLRNILKPVPGATKDITDPLLADLGGDVFAKRETATKRLKDLGLLAEPALRQSLSVNPPLELRQRIEALLKSIVENPPALTPEVLQTLRAVAVLSRIQSPQARQILEDLAKGVESAPLTLAAKAALGS